jgi:hypothetical protein
MKTETLCAVFFTTFLAASCVSKPNRPDSAICLHNSDGWVCTDSRGDFPETENNLICSTIDGYSNLSKYVDALELKIRELERRCK